MPSRGENDSPTLLLEPFFLLDCTTSFSFAPALSAAGFNVTSVRAEFGRDRVDDEEIILHLARVGRYRSVWVTGDEDAQRAHAKLILGSAISVIWMHEPRGKSLTGLQELLLLTLVIRDANRLIAPARRPIYLRASLNGRRPKLERLVNSLLDKKLFWRRVIIEF